jgi:hypothetical protein
VENSPSENDISPIGRAALVPTLPVSPYKPEVSLNSMQHKTIWTEYTRKEEAEVQLTSDISWPTIHPTAPTSPFLNEEPGLAALSSPFPNGEVSGPQAWPALPDEQRTTGQDWGRTRQAWQRQQRLDDEQRGKVWNV